MDLGFFVIVFGLVMVLAVVLVVCYSRMEMPVALSLFAVLMVCCFLLSGAFFNDPGITYQVHEKSERILVADGNHTHVRDGVGTGLDITTTQVPAYPCRVDSKRYDAAPDPPGPISRPLDGQYVLDLADRSNFIIYNVVVDPAAAPINSCSDILGYVRSADYRARVGTHILSDTKDWKPERSEIRPYNQTVIGNWLNTNLYYGCEFIENPSSPAWRTNGGVPGGHGTDTGTFNPHPTIWMPNLATYQSVLNTDDVRALNECRDAVSITGDTFQDTRTEFIILDGSRASNEPLALLFFLLGMLSSFFTMLVGYYVIGGILAEQRKRRMA